MKAREIRDLSVGEIETKLDEAYQELFNLRFQAVVGQFKDYNRLRIVKRDIARLKTIAHEKASQAGE